LHSRLTQRRKKRKQNRAKERNDYL
jgi:hypothetical protein